MGYCFMDIKKIKSLNVMAAKYKHNYREITVPNAVPELSGMNRELVPLIGKDGNPVDYNEAFKQKMESLEYYKDHKLRSNAVLACIQIQSMVFYGKICKGAGLSGILPETSTGTSDACPCLPAGSDAGYPSEDAL